MKLIEINCTRTSRREQSIDRLSPKELQVAELAYLSNADIALAFGISLYTVKNHISRALEKTGAANRTELALMLARANSPCGAGAPANVPARIRRAA